MFRRTVLIDPKTSFAPRIPDHEIIRLIGRGSYGEVWLARNVFGTVRAVKTVRRDAFDSARPYEREFAGIQRFEPVSRGHDGLVDILQVGRNEPENFFYYVMELADAAPAPDGSGPNAPFDLQSYRPLSLSTALELQGRLPIRECILLFRGLAIGLSYLHRAGLVHRDIKPANLIFVGGVAKFADIGLVTTADDSLSYVGTAGFIPPEGAGTIAADIYSLGKVLYEAATGKDRTEFPSLPNVEPGTQDFDGLMELNAVWLKACALAPAERYQNADELASDLALLQAGQSVKRLRVVERRFQRVRRFAVFVCLLAVMASVIGFLAKRQAAIERGTRLLSDRLRERAEAAEVAARDSLEEARIAQARAVLKSPQIGRRDVVLTLLANVASPKLRVQARSLAAAALALPDLVRARPSDPPVSWGGAVAEPRADGTILVRPGSGADASHILPAQGESVREPLVFCGSQRFLYAGYGSFTERIWDLRTERVVARLDTNYFALEFRPGHDEAAVAYVDGAVKVHRLPDWGVRREWRADSSEQRLRWSPDGSRLAIVSASSVAWLADVESGNCEQMDGFDSPIQLVVWHPDGRHLALGTGDGYLRVRDLTAARFTLLLRHEAQLVDAAFLAPFPWLLTSSWDGTSRLWDWHAGVELGRIEATGYGLRFDRTNRVVTWRLGMEPTVQPWRLMGDEIHREMAYGDPRGMRGPHMLSWSGDSRFLAAADSDGIRLWRIEDQTEMLFLPGYSEAVWLDPAGRELYANSAGEIRHWRLERTASDQFAAVELDRLARAPAEGKLAASRDGAVVAWLAGGELHLHQGGADRTILHGQESAEIVAVSPDGRLAAVGTRNHIGARVFQAESGKFLWQTDVRFGTHLAFSHNSRWLAVGTEMGCYVFDSETGQMLWHDPPLPGEEPAFWEVAFSPDDRVLAWTPKSSLVRLTEAATGAEILTFDYPTRRYITRLAFSPDGNWLAEASNKQTIHLWKIDSLRDQLNRMNLGWETAPPPP